MKKNISLYILLFFLLLVNAFFLYNHIGKGQAKAERGKGRNPLSFVIKELGFNDQQMEEMELANEKHHQRMMLISDNTKILKDALFSKMSDETVSNIYIDSITHLIGVKHAELEKEAFSHFRQIQNICTESQKEKFKKIIKEALSKGTRKELGAPHRMNEGPMGPPPGRGDKTGPPPGRRDEMEPPPGRDRLNGPPHGH